MVRLLVSWHFERSDIAACMSRDILGVAGVSAAMIVVAVVIVAVLVVAAVMAMF
jgi:hypothetical protein